MVRGKYTPCVNKALPSRKPSDACYILSFCTLDEDILPSCGEEITLCIDGRSLRARVVDAGYGAKALVASCGQDVSSIHQLGAMIGLKSGDIVELGKQHGGSYTLHKL